MTILLPTLAVTFAAFGIWLTVRIVNRKERWAKWTLAGVVGVPVLYVATWGPAICLCTRLRLCDQPGMPVFYRPLTRCLIRPAPTFVKDAAHDYMLWWMELGAGR
ncbi:MAG: hypothetical protein HY290_29785 [Planctomycetia bacterium]|nr:hypothetical protein [Planctomycetia bacterium]